MDVRNCRKCGSIFYYVSGQVVCAECKKELEIKYKETRQYIRRNPKSSLKTVAEECSVDTKQIKQWIREERLCFSEDSDIGIDCEKCGANIKTGRFCDACRADTLNELNSVGKSQKLAPKDKAPQKDAKGSGMHFMNKDK